jgi:two-component system, sensor histidine kinase PdtaS
MTDSADRPFAQRLSVRFAAILALALLPIGIISLVQTDNLEDEVRAREEAGLLGATLRSAETETGVIRHVQGLVGTLAQSVLPVIADNEACSHLMVKVAALEPLASLAAFIPVDGRMTCSSSGRTYDFSKSPLFPKQRDSLEPSFVVNPKGPISGTSVLGISHPVFDKAGVHLGFAVMSLPHRALRDLQMDTIDLGNGQTAPVIFWTFDREGTLLTASVDLSAAATHVPADRKLATFVGSPGQVFQGSAQNGDQLTYAVVPILPGELYLMSSWNPARPTFLDRFKISAYVPTLMMWLAGLAVSAFAAERLVTRHIRTLHRAMVSFARGNRRLEEIEIKGAPIELTELGSAYMAMTDNITRSEAELEDSVHQKEVLLREVHHRVKNNLQLISSIMNIQIRSAKSGEVRDLLKNLQDRIMSLATVHRSLYQTSGLADVNTGELLPDIVRQIMSLSAGPERPIQTVLDIDDIRLVPDQAVPLSLLLAEALTNAVKHSGAARDHPAVLRVRFKRSGGSDAVMEVTNNHRVAEMNPRDPEGLNTGLGSQLITAFVQQLGGKQEREMSETGYCLRVTFTVTPLSLAENRQSIETEEDERWNASAP